MHPSNLPEGELLESLLQPLLDDFLYWFERSRSFLETKEISFLGAEAQADLLERVKQAQQEVATAKLLFQATGKQVGIATAALIPWHKLVTECWQVSIRWHSTQAAVPKSLGENSESPE